MKHLLSLLLVALPLALAAQKGPQVERIDPAHWYAGLTDPTLQLLVSGPGVREAQVAVEGEGAAVDSVVRLDSPNYLLVYLNVGEARGTLDLQLTLGRHTTHTPYELRERAMPSDQRAGFGPADALYLLMPDRFCNGDTLNDHIATMRSRGADKAEPSMRHGGDLAGIEQHLDYFVDLGVTALWFTPVLENDSPEQGNQSTYHGYATTDYYRVDPRLGTNEQYRELIEAAHQRGLKVVMDMIFNHCGLEHPWVADPPSADWFNHPQPQTPYLQTSYKLTPVIDPYASEVDLRETQEGWFVPTMPDLNQRNPHLMRYLRQNATWWIEYAGIDGIRMDTYPYAYYEPMANWVGDLMTEYPHFNVVGETWVTEPAYTAAFQAGSPLAKQDSHLPTVMDFAFYDRLQQAKREETDPWWKGLNRVYNALVYDYLYPSPSNVLAFIENHDTDRFLEDGTVSVGALRQALALLLTLPRTPQLYYGTEVLMSGVKTVSDGYVREDFPERAFTSEGRTEAEQEMFAWLSALLHYRQGNALITQGRTTQWIPVDGVYAVQRELDGRRLLVVLNGTDQTKTVPWERLSVDAATKECLSLPERKLTPVGALTDLPPRGTLIIEL